MRKLREKMFNFEQLKPKITQYVYRKRPSTNRRSWSYT